MVSILVYAFIGTMLSKCRQRFGINGQIDTLLARWLAAQPSHMAKTNARTKSPALIHTIGV